MGPITPEEIKDTTDISSDTKRKFIEGTLKTFQTFYSGEDVDEQIATMLGFGENATAVINFAYGALAANGQDIGAFIDATKLLAAQSYQE